MNALLTDLHAAAFHGGKATDTLLARGVAGPPRARWLAAVIAGAQGRYAAASALLDPLRADSDAVVSSLACSTMASHRRQLGGHAEARRWDAAALMRATAARSRGTQWPVVHRSSARWAIESRAQNDPDAVDVRGARADALLGLAADALGVGKLTQARALLARAEDTARGCWRTEVRHGWVTAELSLAAGEPAAARAPAEAAARLARAHAADRHAVKSDIVLGVALTASEPQRSRALLDAALETATARGWASLSWPAAMARAQIVATEIVATEIDGRHASQDLRDLARDILHGVLQAADPVGRAIAARSPWVPEPATAGG